MISLNDLIWEDEDITTNLTPPGEPMYNICIIESCEYAGMGFQCPPPPPFPFNDRLNC